MPPKRISNPQSRIPNLKSRTSFSNPWMWTGQRYDVVTGLYSFLRRTYSPTLGRWLQHDPGEYVDGVNLYAYISGNPLMGVDPFGLEESSGL